MEHGRDGSNFTRMALAPSYVPTKKRPQPNRTAVEYWADGLEPIYFEGAFARAQGRLL